MNVWRKGPLTENPYARNAFRIARVPREVVRRKTIVHLIGQARRIVATDPTAHLIAGKPVSTADVHKAEAAILDPVERIRAELLTHATEAPKVGRARELGRRAAEAMASQGGDQTALADPAALRQLLPELLRLYLLSAQEADPELGALELDLVPPFGAQGED